MIAKHALGLTEGVSGLAMSMRTDDDHSPISAQNAKRLFADWKAAPAVVLAFQADRIRSH